MQRKPDAEITLRPIFPFDFDLSCGIYRRFKDYTHTAYIDEKLYKCLEVEGNSSLITINEKKGILKADLYGANLVKLGEIAGWIVSADLDLKPLYDTTDRVMSSILEKLNGLKPPRTASVYEALVIAIIEQQINLRVAHIFQNRLVERYGTVYRVGSLKFHSFPTPKSIASADWRELRQLGLSKNKATYITDISQKVASGALDLESLKNKPTEKAEDELLSLRGVGKWTAKYVLIRGLGRADMVPYDDLGVRDSVGLFYKGGERVSGNEAEIILSRFGAYAGIASYYLIYARLLRI